MLNLNNNFLKNYKRMYSKLKAKEEPMDTLAAIEKNQTLKKLLVKKKLAKYRKSKKKKSMLYLKTPTRFRRKLWGHWKRNIKWRRRKYLPEISIKDFWTKPKKETRRWIFIKHRRLSGIIPKKKRWKFKTRQQRWLHRITKEKTRKLKKVFGRNSRELALTKRGISLQDKQPVISLAKKFNKYLNPQVKAETPALELKDFKFTKFSDKGLRKFAKTQHKDYNHIFNNLPLLSQDLPVFALDLYNLYLHNLEQEKPLVVEQAVTRQYRKKVNKKYRRLLVQYTKLLASFYKEAILIRARKRTAEHNALSLIKQFSRVAGSRTVNPLNKPRRWDTNRTIHFYLRHKHYKKFWRTKKSLFKMRVVISRILLWLYDSQNSKHLLGTKLRKGFLGNYNTDKQFIYKKNLKLHLKFVKPTSNSLATF